VPGPRAGTRAAKDAGGGRERGRAESARAGGARATRGRDVGIRASGGSAGGSTRADDAREARGDDVLRREKARGTKRERAEDRREAQRGAQGRSGNRTTTPGGDSRPNEGRGASRGTRYGGSEAQASRGTRGRGTHRSSRGDAGEDERSGRPGLVNQEGGEQGSPPPPPPEPLARRLARAREQGLREPRRDRERADERYGRAGEPDVRGGWKPEGGPTSE
jgi:hypothetical protein